MNLKQTLKLAMLVLSGLLLQSCTSVSKFSTAKTLDIEAVVNQKPTLADLEIKDKKVTGTASYKITEKGIDAIKQEAVANALKSVNADILVEPNIESVMTKSTVTITVTGYPGFYKNFRAIKTEDLPVLESVLFNVIPTATLPATNGLNNIFIKQ